MDIKFSFKLLITFFLIQQYNTQIYINEYGQYKNIIVKLESVFPNCSSLEVFITSLNATLREFSNILFNKTNGVLSVTDVKVILPQNLTCTNLKQEPLVDESLASKASIVVGFPDPYLGDQPYTLHLGSCGEEGEYIHLTKELILKRTHDTYNTRSMMLLHEWSHYRWGVFDEYGSGGEATQRFYLTGQKKIAVTGCPTNLRGWLLTSKHTKCSLKSNGLPEDDCTFYIDSSKHRGKVSIMMGYANWTDQFCGLNSTKSSFIKHNAAAPNVHNLRCGGQSVWEIIRTHSDFRTRPKYKRSKKVFLTLLGRNKIKERRTKPICIFLDEFELKKKHISKMMNVLKSCQKIGKLSNLDLYFSTFKSCKQLSNCTISFAITTLNRYKTKYSSIIKIKPIIYFKALDQMIKSTLFPKIFLSVPHFELTNQIMEIVFGFAVNQDKIPVIVHKKQFFGKETNGHFYINSACEKTLFIAEVDSINKSSIPNVTLTAPNGTKCKVSQNLNSNLSLCKISLQISFSLVFIEIKSNLQNFKIGEWQYDIASPFKFKSALVACDANYKSHAIKIEPKIKSSGYGDTFMGSSFGERVSLTVRITKNRKIVSNATVTCCAIDELGKEQIETLYDNGEGLDLAKNDGIYSGELLKFQTEGVHSLSFRVVTNNQTKALLRIKATNTQNPPVINVGSNSPNAIKTLRETEIEKIQIFFKEAKDEFDITNFAKFVAKNEKITYIFEDVETQERFSPSKNLAVSGSPTGDMHPPGKVTDLIVARLSYQYSVVSLEWTSSGDDGYTGTAHRIILRYSSNQTFYPFHFYAESILVEQSDLKGESTLIPKKAREKHKIDVKVPNPHESVYLENAVFFFALIVLDEMNHSSEISNLATAFFKPAEYSEEIQTLKKQSSSGLMVLIVFAFFIALIATFIGIVRYFHAINQVKQNKARNKSFRKSVKA